jgi:hypothetical protein
MLYPAWDEALASSRSGDRFATVRVASAKGGDREGDEFLVDPTP